MSTDARDSHQQRTKQTREEQRVLRKRQQLAWSGAGTGIAGTILAAPLGGSTPLQVTILAVALLVGMYALHCRHQSIRHDETLERTTVELLGESPAKMPAWAAADLDGIPAWCKEEAQAYLREELNLSAVQTATLLAATHEGNLLELREDTLQRLGEAGLSNELLEEGWNREWLRRRSHFRKILREIISEAGDAVVDLEVPSTIEGVEMVALHREWGREYWFEGTFVRIHPMGGDSDLLAAYWQDGRNHGEKALHIPEPAYGLDEDQKKVYHHARTGGHTTGEALEAARAYRRMPLESREVYMTLLSDGMEWVRAAEMATDLIER